jgi:hypothetical protein
MPKLDINLFPSKSLKENLPTEDNQNTEVDTEIKSTQEDKKQIPFIPLKTIFRKNGTGYRLLKRNNNLALFALSTDRHWEIDRIYITPANDRFGKHFPEMEAISNETQFGRDGSRTFQNYEKALRYFDELSKKLGYARSVLDFSHFDSEVDSYTTPEEIVPPRTIVKIRDTNKTSVVRLKEVFKKNGLECRQIERTENVGLYSQHVTKNKTLCGYEVARIKILPAHVFPDGHQSPEREAIASDAEFGISDGSKCFFALEPKRARQYFENLNAEITAIENGSDVHFYTNKYSTDEKRDL